LPERWLVAQPLYRGRDLPGGQGEARLDLTGKFVMGWRS
jgi:hypothetical protein